MRASIERPTTLARWHRSQRAAPRHRAARLRRNGRTGVHHDRYIRLYIMLLRNHVIKRLSAAAVMAAVGWEAGVNGDGFDDIIIGAHTADPNASSAGRSYMVLGARH